MVYIALSAAVLLVGIDQWIKYIVDTNMAVGSSIAVWPDVLHWTYLQNRGAAFGIWEGQTWILVGLTSVVILVCIYLLLAKKIKSSFLIWSVSLIIAGGVGNLIDRIFRHFVIDYIEVRLIHFAIFNFADCCVVVGTILVVCYLLCGEWFQKKRAEKQSTLTADIGDSKAAEQTEEKQETSIAHLADKSLQSYDVVAVDWEDSHAK